jgi:hypothetical protein
VSKTHTVKTFPTKGTQQSSCGFCRGRPTTNILPCAFGVLSGSERMIFSNKTGLGLIGFQFTMPRTSTLGGMALNLPYLHDSTPHRRSTHSSIVTKILHSSLIVTLHSGRSVARSVVRLGAKTQAESVRSGTRIPSRVRHGQDFRSIYASVILYIRRTIIRNLYPGPREVLQHAMEAMCRISTPHRRWSATDRGRYSIISILASP